MFFPWISVFILVLLDSFALAPSLLQVNLMESIFNYYALHIVYPSLNGKNSCYSLPMQKLNSTLSVGFMVHSFIQQGEPLFCGGWGVSDARSLPSWSSHVVGKADM